MIEHSLHRLKEHFSHIKAMFQVESILLYEEEIQYGRYSTEEVSELLNLYKTAESMGDDPVCSMVSGTEHFGSILYYPLPVLSEHHLLIITEIREQATVEGISSFLSMMLGTFTKRFYELSEDPVTMMQESRQQTMLMQLWKAGRWEYDLETEENHIDDNWKSVFGVPNGVDIDDFHQYFEDHIHPDDSKMLYQLMDDFISGRTDSYHSIFRFNSEEKGLIWLEGHAMVAGVDNDGNPRKVVGLNRDVTESFTKKVELENTNRLLASLLENMPSGVFWKDTDSVYLGANDVFAHDAGVDSYKDVIGKTDKDLPFVSAEYEYYREQDREVMEGRKPVLNEVNQLFNAEGQKGWSYTSKVPLINASDEVFGLLGVYTDISDLKHAEQQLKEKDRRLQAILDSSSDVIWTVGTDFRTEFVSPSASRLLGYPIEELRSLPISSFMTENSYIALEDIVRSIYVSLKKNHEEIEYIDLKYSRQLEITAIKEDGTTIPMDLVITPLAEKETGLFGYLSILRDMTDRKRLEEQMRHAQRIESVSRLAGGVAHDFNNLLQVILGYSELVSDTLKEGSDEGKMLNSVIDAGYKAKSLVEQLLRFSQNTELKLRGLNLYDHIRQLMPKLYPVFGADVRLQLKKPEQLSRILADAHQIEHLVLNICLNANDAMPEGGEFTIETHDVTFHEDKPVYSKMIPAGQYVCLSLKDTGVGMEQSHVENLFDPFFSTKHPSAGAGLGLSIIFGIINEHNGYIDVRSIKGSGTIIYIYFPVYNP